MLLRDLVAIPDEVHAGDFVLGLAQGIHEKSTITDYVVTNLLAQDFDRALGVIKSAVETGTSRAAYLDVVARHDPWLTRSQSSGHPRT